MADEITVNDNPSLDSAMDSFFSAPAEETPSKETQSPEPEADQVADPNTQKADQVADGSEGGDNTEGTTEESLADEEVGPIETEGKKAIQIDVPRWNTVYQGYKLAQQIREFAPSVESAKAQYETSNDYRVMHADFQSADPENIDAWLDHWAEESPDGFSAMASRLPEKLQALNPEAWESLQGAFLQKKIDQLYAEAAESGDQQAKYYAQLLDYKVNGKYRETLDKPDPIAARQKELDARQAKIDQQESERQGRVWSNFSTRIETAKQQGLSAVIDKILTPIRDRFQGAPELFEALKDRIATKAQSAIKNDFEWSRNHDIDLRSIKQSFDKSWKTGGKTNMNADAQALVGQYVSKASGIVASAAKPLVAQATASLVQQSNDKHAQLQKGQVRRGSSGGGKPSPRGFAPQLPENATLDQKMDSFFAAL